MMCVVTSRYHAHIYGVEYVSGSLSLWRAALRYPYELYYNMTLLLLLRVVLVALGCVVRL